MKKLLLFLILMATFSCKENKKEQSKNKGYKEKNEVNSDSIIKKPILLNWT